MTRNNEEIPRNVTHISLEWSNKAQSLTELGKYDDALLCCNRATEHDEMNVNAWVLKEIILRETLEKYDEAITCFDKIIESIEFNKIENSIKKTLMSDAWSNKGVSLFNLGNIEKSVPCYKKAIELNKENFYAWYSLGGAYMVLEKFEEAADCLYEAIPLRKKDIPAWELLGTILHKMGMINESNGIMKYAQKLSEDIDRL